MNNKNNHTLAIVGTTPLHNILRVACTTHSLMSKPLKCRSASIQYLDQNVVRKAHGDKCVVVGQRSATATLMSQFLCCVTRVCTGSWGLHVEETHTAFLMRNTGKKRPQKNPQNKHTTTRKKSHNTFYYVFSRLKRYLVWKVTDTCKIFTCSKQKAQRCNDGGRVKKS